MAEAPLWLLQNYQDAPTSTPPSASTADPSDLSLYSNLANVQTICGRCQSLPTAYDLKVTWETPPPAQFAYIFDSIRLNRTLIQQPGLLVSNSDWVTKAPPPLSNACCNFSSRILGATRQVISPAEGPGIPTTTVENPIFNLQWFLFYGNSSDCISGPVPYSASDFDTTLLNADPLASDSAFNNTSNDPLALAPASVSGWCLVFLHRNIAAAGDQNTVTFDNYGMYQLKPKLWYVDEITDPPTSHYHKPVYKCGTSNEWVLALNSLDLPQHTIRTIPVGP